MHLFTKQFISCGNLSKKSRKSEAMAVQKRPNHSDLETSRSPICKKARYDLDEPEIAPWTLSKNELVLHSVYDQGVDSLNSENLIVGSKKCLKSAKKNRLSSEAAAKREQIAVLEAALPENSINSILTEKEFDKIVNTKPESYYKDGNTDQNAINYFDYLSDEVILQIFQKLTKTQLVNLAQVCQRFNHLVEDESLWVRLDCSERTLAPGIMGKIMGRQAIILKLSRTKIKTPALISFPSDLRLRLMYLDLTMAKIKPECLTEIFSRCTRLKKLSLESVPINDEVLVALSGNKDLEVINLAMSEGIGLKGMTALLNNCRKIRELNLSWTYLEQNVIEFICNKLPPTLDRFNFSGCRKFLLDKNVSRIVQNCPNLRELDLSDCAAITGESIKKITNLHDLNYLAISRCYLVPRESLMFLRMNKNLSYLDIHLNFGNPNEYKIIKDSLGYRVHINEFMFSSIARPCVGNKSNIWNMRVRD